MRRRIDNYMVPGIVGISIAVPLLVLLLMYLPEYNFLQAQVGSFPFFHAILNFTTTMVLLLGYFFMRIGEYKWHRNTMIMAFLLSTVFLVSYVISKINNDPVHFEGEGILVPIYYFILITHIVLSAIIVPLVLFTIYRGLTGEFDKHAKIARWTLPIWLYVSVTGVLVYIFMSPYY